MKKVAKLLTCVTFTFVLSVSVFAQNPGDPGGGTDPDASIPLDDGGLVTILISGACIGVYRLLKIKKTRRD